MTDEKLRANIKELENDIYGVLEEYCHMKNEGFIVYSGMAHWVDKLIEYSYELGKRSAK